MVRVVVDSDCDFTLEEANKYNAVLLSMPYEVNGEIFYPYVDKKEYKSKDFYNMLRNGVIPSTSALNEMEYERVFEPIFANGDDILYIHFSREMSASFNYMDNVVDRLLKKYPGRKFDAIDTRAITIGGYAVAIECLDMFKEGKSVEEIKEWAKNNVDKFTTYFFADDLKFFRKSGRVSNFAGIMGNLIGIKPIIYMDEHGSMTNIAKAKGTKNAIKMIMDYFDKLKDPDFKKHRIIIGHTDAGILVDKVIEELKAKYGDDLNIEVHLVNPTIGSHCGPDALGINFYALHK